MYTVKAFYSQFWRKWKYNIYKNGKFKTGSLYNLDSEEEAIQYGEAKIKTIEANE